MLTRYWIEFDITQLPPDMFFLRRGCGVTGYNLQDALTIVQQKIFSGQDLPPVASLTEDVDISLLDPDHILPNMEPPNFRGIWFPVGFR